MEYGVFYPIQQGGQKAFAWVDFAWDIRLCVEWLGKG